MRRIDPRSLLRALTLAVWGGVFVYFWAIGRLPVYLVPGFRPLVPIAGFVLLAFAVLSFFTSHRDGENATAVLADRKSWGSTLLLIAQAFLLLAPIIASAVVAPTGFSATTVLNRLGENWDELPSGNPYLSAGEVDGEMQGDFTLDDAAAIDESLPLPGEEPEPDTAVDSEEAFDPEPYIARDEQGRIEADLTDLWTAAADPAFRRHFAGQPIRVLGQLLVPKRLRKSGVEPGKAAVFKVARLMIFCCAADAQPVAVQVEASSVPSGKDMDWVQIDGRLDFRAQGGELVPLVRAESVAPAKAPEEIYLTY
jgi:uncharacterized repeat protein (TIGR03943 family)